MNAQTLEQYRLPDGCRCDNEPDLRKLCGRKDTPPKCAHRIASDALAAMDDIERDALLDIGRLENRERGGIRLVLDKECQQAILDGLRDA